MTKHGAQSLLAQTIHSLRSQLTVYRFDDSLDKESLITQLSGFLKRVELLDSTQLGPSHHPMKIIHLVRVLSTVLSNLEPDQRARIQTHNLPLTIYANQEMIEVLLYELIDNALQYSHDEVHVSLHKAGDKVVIRVEDFGPGIPASVRRRIAEPYVSLGAGSTSSDGLGLAIAWAVTQANAGTMTLVCEADQGTTAILSFANAKYRS